MKKSIIALTFACASAFAYAAPVTGTDYTDPETKEQWNLNWFTGIGINPTSITPTIALDSTNAVWTGLTADNAAITDNKLVLDLDTTDTANIALGGTAAPVDTNTCHVIKFTAVLTPIAVGDLPEEFGSSDPQTGFALVYDSTYVNPYNYQVWDGRGWRESNIYLASAPTSEVSVEVYVDYWTNDAKRVSVKVGDNFLYFDGESTIYQILSTDSNNISSVQIKGSGTIASLNGDMQYAVATMTYNDETTKYPTLASAVEDANTHAGEVGSDAVNVNVLRETVEDVEIAGSNISIVDPNGNVKGEVNPSGSAKVNVAVVKDKDGNSVAASGEHVLAVKVGSSSSIDNYVVSVPTNKEVVAGSTTTTNIDSKTYIKITTQTAGAVIMDSAAKPTGGATVSNAGLAGVRTYLNKYAKTAYEAADVTSASIKAALETVPTPASGTSNGLELWKICAMGIEANTSLKPIGNPEGQTQSDAIKIAIPDLSSVTANSDYTVSYEYNDGTSDHTIDNPAAFTVPNNANGTYTIKAVITPKN